LHDRVVEEEKRVGEDIRCSIEYFFKLHDSMSTSFEETSDIGKRAEILAKLFNMLQLVNELWRVGIKHISDVHNLPESIRDRLKLFKPPSTPSELSCESETDVDNVYIDLDYDVDSDGDDDCNTYDID